MDALGMKAQLTLKNDSVESGYFTDNQLSMFLSEAQRKVIKSLYDEYQRTQKVTEYLSGVVAESTTLSNASYETIPADFGYLLQLKLGYADGNFYKADLLRENETNRNPFETPSTMFPKYRITDKIYFYPQSVTSIFYTYIVAVPDIDIVGAPSTTPPYSTDVQDMIIDEALKLIAISTREIQQAQVQQSEIQINP